jgi:cell wall assembly regulator SMI1
MGLFDFFKKNNEQENTSQPDNQTDLQIQTTREAFAKILDWLTTNANKISELTLQAGTNDNKLSELETLIGRKLPEDFKEMYRLHNGMDSSENMASFFYGMDFYSIDRIISEFNRKIGIKEPIKLKKSSKEIDMTNIYNPNWLCFGFDGAHTSLLLDFSPTQHGNDGQIIFVDDENEIGILVATSTAELLTTFANDLENGLYSLDEGALDDDCHFLAADKDIDIVNWYNADRWKGFETK